MAEPALAAQNVFKSYGQDASAARVLKNLTCDIYAGEFVALLGPSGSGKSTLLNVLGLMDAPDSGTIRLGGRLTAGLNAAARARLRNESLGFIFQFDSLLPEFTLLENALMPWRIAAAHGRLTPSPSEAKRRALGLLDRFGLASAANRFPSQASGGERQRTALCRALVNSPLAILADEPTGNLDKANAELVFKDLRDLARSEGAAVLMATHNEESLRYASRAVRLQDGALAGAAQEEKPA